jgi:hypothetical protein
MQLVQQEEILFYSNAVPPHGDRAPQHQLENGCAHRAIGADPEDRRKT